MNNLSPHQHHSSSNPSTSERGIVTLMSMLVVSALGVAISTTLVLLAIGSSKNSLALQQSAQARALADACAEMALNSLRSSVNYAGNETISLSPGSCLIGPLGGSGNSNRTIQTTGTVGAITRKISITVGQVTPQLQVTSWQEVADF